MAGVYANVIAFVAGVMLLQQRATLSGWTPFAWAMSVAVGCLLLRRGVGRRPWAARLLAALAAAAIGFGWAFAQAQWRLADALSAEREGQDILVSGTIATSPDGDPLAPRFLFVPDEGEAGLPRRVELRWYAPRDGRGPPLPRLAPGQRWRLAVRLKRPHGHLNPHGPDAEARWLEAGVRLATRGAHGTPARVQIRQRRSAR